MSSVRRKDSCRWSDPILRRRKATASGDSDSSGSVLSPSIKNPPPPPPLPPLSNLPQDSALQVECWCHRKCQESLHVRKNSLLAERRSRNKRESNQAQIVQRLSMKISEYKGQDLEEMEHYSALKNLFNQFRSSLDFVVHYAKCLELQHNTNLRLHRLVCTIVPTPTHHLMDLLNTESSELVNIGILKDVIEQAALVLEDCSRIGVLKQEFKMKTNDFLLATSNFDLLLTNLKVMSSQLRKIELQYDDIFFSLRQSQTTLEHEMTKITAKLRESLSQCFRGLGSWLEHMGKNCSHLVELFSCLEDELKTQPPTEPSSPMKHSVGTTTDPVGDVGRNCTCTLCPEHNSARPRL